jgi:hypothetical protein
VGGGNSAKCEEAAGIDLIVIYNSSHYRMAGRAVPRAQRQCHIDAQHRRRDGRGRPAPAVQRLRQAWS